MNTADRAITPPGQEGWLRHKERAKHPKRRRRGGGSGSINSRSIWNHHPVRSSKDASRYFS